ncbi:GNAT family N-acetyltransferase [Neorhizobium sp. AL 9.2.2]|uniref:GNAT family N-acetyltransferase n=1 Tax=Neorhizobium sp. AL 9.2.2 TaxID=2712894 RepID=UPI001574A25F|nr:GNAT family N-acetyltransferase [Neorhizobium sp. AL 9.2.2]NSY17620.1 GNAT family N-acetyltransferase [Neorhizobium sp. AL 9.2.2]
MDLEIVEGISQQDEDIILDKLKAFNIECFGASDRRELAIPLRDTAGDIAGGLVGYTGRGWLYISMLFIPELMRAKGLAARLMTMAEAEAAKRGCIGAYIDTMNPAALALYLKLGYQPIGKLEGLAGGHDVTWLEKRF